MYLAALGADESFQCQYAGTRLLRPTLDEFDREGKTANLQSSNPRNVSFYERLGVQVVETDYSFEGFPKVSEGR